MPALLWLARLSMHIQKLVAVFGRTDSRFDAHKSLDSSRVLAALREDSLHHASDALKHSLVGIAEVVYQLSHEQLASERDQRLQVRLSSLGRHRTHRVSVPTRDGSHGVLVPSALDRSIVRGEPIRVVSLPRSVDNSAFAPSSLRRATLSGGTFGARSSDDLSFLFLGIMFIRVRIRVL